MNERNALLRKIMEYSFSALEWNLYLNTHPYDRKAINMFKRMSEKAQELKTEFAQRYGPLYASDVNSEEEWTWINDPWPWDFQGRDK